jgi:putative glutamine amidotransferase
MTRAAPAARTAAPPRIGIPICLGERTPGGEPYQYLGPAYAAAVEAAGGIPLYLPVQRDVSALIEQIDGLLIPGGSDFLPPRPYPASVRFEPVLEAQLRFDRSLLEAARARERPVLGICYGMQLMALVHGGSLHYDIASDLAGALEHRRVGAQHHAIALDADSRLAALLGANLNRVNTAHHQAVAEPGRGLRVCARAPDGVVEAIEAFEGTFCVGVQWHPERSDTAAERALLRAFVDASRSHSR